MKSQNVGSYHDEVSFNVVNDAADVAASKCMS